MKKTKALKQKGSSLPAILVILIVTVAVGAGAYAYHRSHGAKKANTSNTTKAISKGANDPQAQSQNTPTAQSDQVKYTGTEAVSLVQSTYASALSYVKRTTNADQGEIDTIKSSLTPDFYSQLSTNLAKGTDHDQVLCSQMTPDSLTATLSSANATTARINVAEVFGTDNSNITITVNLDSLRISGITCL